MTSTKSSPKASPSKRPTPETIAAPTKAKTVAKAKKVVKPEPVAKTAAAPKATPRVAPKKAPKAAPKSAAALPVRSSAGKKAGVPAEQRRNYIEMAAYYIAERRGFAPGNPLEDWVQAEAEIDRLLAEGRLGR